MPPIEAHVKASLARTGKTYIEVHEWVDKDETKKVERHDIKRLVDNAEHVRRVWGEEAAREYVAHVHDDIKARVGHAQEEGAKQVSEALAYFGIR